MGNWGYPWPKNKNPLALPPGSLRDQITIQQKSLTPDPATGKLPVNGAAWSNLLTVMAKIRTLTQREVYQSGQIVGQVTHEIAMYWPGISMPIEGGMQVVFGNRIFLIQTPENVQERNRVLLLHCLEIDGASA